MARIIELEHLPIRLTERGQWLHGDSPLHPKVASLFARSIVPHRDGRYSLVVGRDEEEVRVEDAAFFVETMKLVEEESGGLRAVEIVLSDDGREELDPETLMISEDNVLYCRVMRHGLLVPCRFPPSLYHRLALHVEEDPGLGFVLALDGRRWPIRSYRPLPLEGEG